MCDKLILHFDARNTLFVSDFNSRLTTEEALNTYISGLVWGTVNNGNWEIAHPEISTDRPNNSLVSFYKYMESSLVKTPDDRPKLRRTLGKFTEENGTKFRSIFLKHLKLLEWDFEFNKYLTVKGNNDKLYHYILPTFFSTIKNLYQQKRNFAIIIRSFGLDIPPILNAINAFLNGEHPMYQEKMDINLCFFVNKLTMNRETQEYEYHFKINNKDEIMETSNETDIFEHWNSIQGISAVKDDFDYWSENKFHYSASKPLWIDYKSEKSQQKCHHIFFDDCIRPRDVDSIVHLRQIHSIDPNSPSNGEHSTSVILNPSETEQYVNVNLVQSDLLKCISNNNYFTEMISLCEENFIKIHH